jgi:hypothetical protein
MFLYSNGDSFVEGCELGDFLLSGYPGAVGIHEIHVIENKNIRQWFNDTRLMNTPLWHERKKLLPEIEQEEKARNFTTKLAKSLGVNFFNNALGGSGMDRITRTTISDLIELKKTEKNIVALIGTTEPLRMELPVMNTNPWWPVHPGNSVNDKMMNDVVNYYSMNVGNYHKMLAFYKNVILIQDFCKINAIKLLWVSGNSNIVNDFDIEQQYADQKDIQQLTDYANFKLSADMQQIAKSIVDKTVLPGYHYSEIVHEETARQLKELI